MTSEGLSVQGEESITALELELELLPLLPSLHDTTASSVEFSPSPCAPLVEPFPRALATSLHDTSQIQETGKKSMRWRRGRTRFSTATSRRFLMLPGSSACGCDIPPPPPPLPCNRNVSDGKFCDLAALSNSLSKASSPSSPLSSSAISSSIVGSLSSSSTIPEVVAAGAAVHCPSEPWVGPDETQTDDESNSFELQLLLKESIGRLQNLTRVSALP